MFSFRRRPRTADTEPQLKTSPSLPELHSQGIPWPEDLVDVSVIRESPPAEPERHSRQGAVKSSLPSSDHAPVPFHKPFRLISGQPAENGSKISSLYMSHPPSAFGWRSSTAPTSSSSTRRAHRKNRTPPAFNLMVVGGRGTGKTSLLRLLLETADISPTATEDQRVSLENFLKGSLKRTQHINTACVEIHESRYDRVLLTVIDTPALDFSGGRELRVERQVSGIIKYLDTQYADTMSEESKVVRQSKGDQHVHLCIFMVDPSSILSASSRRDQSPMPGRARSNTTGSYPSAGDLQEADSDPEYSKELAMSPAELRVIRRLSARVNVLPVIAHADSLTDETLSLVKAAVCRDLESAGLDFGVFSSPKPKVDSSIPISPSDDRAATTLQHEVNGHRENGVDDVHHNGGPYVPNDSGQTGRPSRPVITLRGMRPSRSRSRSRRELAAQDEREPYYPDGAEEDSVANIRFSAHVVSKSDLSTLLPFALIAPEQSITPRIRQAQPASPESNFSPEGTPGPSSPVLDTPISPDSPAVRKPAFMQSSPEDLRGVFTRKFRWGTVDVLNPAHCDFAALRTAVLLTHLKVLKVHTREVLYEKYRTEKLLARRATRNIGPEEAKRLLEDLGL